MTGNNLPFSATATWHDGKTAAAYSVRIELDAQGGALLIIDPEDIAGESSVSGNILATWPLESIHVHSGALTQNAEVPVRLCLEPDDGQRLVLESQDAISKLAFLTTPKHSIRRKRHLRRWIYGTIAVWLFCVGFYFASPLIFTGVATLIPKEWEESLGESSQENILESLSLLSISRGIVDSATKSPDLVTLMQRLEAAGSDSGYTFRVSIIDANFVNAFALPGGYMVVSSGLIQACESPDELAAVLAHEMAHVTERHGVSRLLRQYTWSAILKLFGNTDSGMGGLPLILITSSFDRDQEREADHLGVLRLVHAGINPDAMRTFFHRLQKKEAPWNARLSYINSHPALNERQKNISKSTAQGIRALTGTDTPPAYTPAMPPEAWKRFKALCPASQAST